jgi:hypothetical protein
LTSLVFSYMEEFAKDPFTQGSAGEESLHGSWNKE